MPRPVPVGRARRAKGDRFERECRAWLRAHGWTVIRAGGSLGPADLVAFRADSPPWFISCKANTKAYLRPAEWAELWRTAVSVNGCPVLAHHPAPGRTGIAFLALLAPTYGTRAAVNLRPLTIH